MSRDGYGPRGARFSRRPNEPTAADLGLLADPEPDDPTQRPVERPDSSTMVDDDLVIRPFLLTQGRTRPRDGGLRLETLIVSRTDADPSALRFETRRIVELCRQPISLAEVAAALRIPIGVTRVLVGDLIIDGTVSAVVGGELSVRLLERIRDRVRAL